MRRSQKSSISINKDRTVSHLDKSYSCVTHDAHIKLAFGKIANDTFGDNTSSGWYGNYVPYEREKFSPVTYWLRYVFFLDLDDRFVHYYFLFYLFIYLFIFLLGGLGYIFGCDLISYGLVLLSLWICVLIIRAIESIFRFGYFSVFFIFLVIALTVRSCCTFRRISLPSFCIC